MKEILTIVQILQNVVTIVAILVGGLWSYFRFFRGRTFYPRIILSASGAIIDKVEKKYVVVAVCVENNGNSAIHIDHNNTVLALHNEHGIPGYGELFDIIRILSKCDIVEPQEKVKDEQVSLLEIQPELAIRLVFHLQSKPYLTWRGTKVSRWTSSVLILQKYD